MLDSIGLILLGGIGLNLLIYLCLISYKRYEIVVFFVTFSPLISAVFSVIQGPEIARQDATLGSYLRISLLLLMGLIGSIKFLLARFNQDQKLPVQIKLLGVFLLIALVSTIYSMDPFYTFVRTSSFIALYGFLLGLYAWLQDNSNYEKAINSIFYTVTFITLANLIALLILGDRVWWSTEGSRFSGIWGHPNLMGAFSLISYPIIFWKYSKSRFPQKWLVIGLFLILVFLQVLTGSRTSILAGAFGIALWFLVQRKQIKLVILFSSLIIIAYIISENTDIYESFNRETEYGRSLTTLTGRAEFWSETFALIKEKPITGFGFGIAGKILSESSFFNPDIRLWSGSARSSLHNGYVSIFSGVGIFGFLLWCAILIIPLFRMKHIFPVDFRAVLLAIIFTAMTVNFVEDAINPGSSFMGVIYWIAWLMLSKIPESQKQTASDQ